MVLRTYIDSILNIGARQNVQGSDEARAFVEVMSAFWLSPQPFMPRSAVSTTVNCLEATLTEVPPLRLVRSIQALLDKATGEDCVVFFPRGQQSNQLSPVPFSPYGSRSGYQSSNPPTSGGGGYALAWPLATMMPSLYRFLRAAFMHSITQSAGKDVLDALKYGGELDRYLRLWRRITNPKIHGHDSWCFYIHRSFLFFTVVLIDVIRALTASYRVMYRSVDPRRERPHHVISSILNELLDRSEHSFNHFLFHPSIPPSLQLSIQQPTHFQNNRRRAPCLVISPLTFPLPSFAAVPARSPRPCKP